MLGMSQPHWEAALRELASPTYPEPVEYKWRQKYDMGPMPTSLSSETWTPAEFQARGFPSRELPTSPVVTLKVEHWDELVTSMLNEKVITTGHLPPLNEVREWMAYGCPAYLQPPGTTPTDLPHHITEEQVPMVSLNILKP